MLLIALILRCSKASLSCLKEGRSNPATESAVLYDANTLSPTVRKQSYGYPYEPTMSAEAIDHGGTRAQEGSSFATAIRHSISPLAGYDAVQVCKERVGVIHGCWFHRRYFILSDCSEIVDRPALLELKKTGSGTFRTAHSANTILSIVKNEGCSLTTSVTAGFCGSPADRRSRSCTFVLRFRSAASGSRSSSSSSSVVDPSLSMLNSWRSAWGSQMLVSEVLSSVNTHTSFKPKSLLLKAFAPGMRLGPPVPSAAIFCLVLS